MAAQSSPLPIENIQLRGDRFRGLHYREMTEEQRALLYNVVNSARAVTNTTGNGPFNMLLRSPRVGEQSQQLGNALRFSAGLSPRLRELATLMAGRAWTSTYEWYAHERYARDEGIDTAVIAAIAMSRAPDLSAMSVEDAAVWRVTDELLYTRRISDATYDDALAALGEQRLLAVVVIAAYYEYVSMLLNVDRYPLPANAPTEAAAAARALVPLSTAELSRPLSGAISQRRIIVNSDIEPVLGRLANELLSEPISSDSSAAPLVWDIVLRTVVSHWRGELRLDVPNVLGTHRDIGTAARFAAELLATRFVDDETFGEAVAAFGERGVVNLLVFMGVVNIGCARSALSGAACIP